MTPRAVSANLALDEEITRRLAAGEQLVHLGFGESRLPTHEGLVRALADCAGRTGYGPVAGSDAARAAVAGYFTRRALATDAEHVVLAPGSKPVLFAVVDAVAGDVLLPRPCWLTYAPQARLLGRTPLPVDIPPDCGGVPDPLELATAVRAARSAGHDPRLLVLTLPDNPTGTVASPSLVRAVCAVAEDEDLIIVSDEIYRDLVHDPALPFLSPARVVPDRTVVTTGLSKTHALGGWRIGAARFPNPDLREQVLATASEVWSSLAMPMQSVAEYAFGEPADLVAHVRAGARAHAAVARAVYEIMVDHGAVCREPTGGFYVYPDFGGIAERLGAHGIHDSASLERTLLGAGGVAVLGGHHFGDGARALRFRAATSLLLGDTDEQRRAALDATNPVTLPHVERALHQTAEGFAKLTA